jgi:serine/threonine protein kinase
MQPAADLIIAERFRLVRLLGRGGMGSVWLAQHLGLDIPCAVKFIEGEYAAMAEAQARFGREAKAAAALRSPHVVQILDHGIWQGTPYMAMELLEGEDLGKRLQRIGRMPPRDVCTIVTQIARALTKAHGAGIVHRDLKPDNIYLVKDDEREIAKVLDFGIAKHSNQTLEGGATKTGAMLGTPYYMSPEQAQGIKAVDHRSDLWSLGVIVYQALTGRLPFESEALGDLLVRIIVAPIPVPSEIAPGLPLSFDRWWAKASNRDPAMRYQSAKELSDGLSLVFGQSQLTDVMDRSELHAAMGQPVQANTPGYGASPMSNTPHPGAMHATPHPIGPGTPVPYGTPQPQYGTPQPQYGTPHPQYGTPQPQYGTPQPQYGTPQPYGSSQPGFGPPQGYPQGAPPPEATTGAPMARTFGEQPQVPKKRTGLIVGIGAGVLVLAVVGVGLSLKGKGGPPAQASNPPAPTVSAPAPSATATELASATLPPPAAASDTTAPSATASVAAAPTTTAPWRPGPATAAPPPRPAPTPKPGKKSSDGDLGI